MLIPRSFGLATAVENFLGFAEWRVINLFPYSGISEDNGVVLSIVNFR